MSDGNKTIFLPDSLAGRTAAAALARRQAEKRLEQQTILLWFIVGLIQQHGESHAWMGWTAREAFDAACGLLGISDSQGTLNKLLEDLRSMEEPGESDDGKAE